MWDKFLIVRCCAIIVPFLTLFAPMKLSIYTTRQRSLGEGNVFSSVCLSVVLSVHRMGALALWTSLNLLSLDLTVLNATPPQNMFKVVHYVSKRVVGIQLKCLLVFYAKGGVVGNFNSVTR